MDLPCVSRRLVVLSPNRGRLRRCRSIPPFLNRPPSLPPCHRLAGASVRLLKIWCSWAQPAPEFINLHLKDNSGTSRRPYVLWLLDSFPLLGFSARRWGSLITHADGLWCSFILTTSLSSSSHLGMLNLWCTLKLRHLLHVIYCKSLQI